MNKVFFVVFLGIILGAMALIFVNQASPPAGVAGTYREASRETGSAGGTAGVPVTAPLNDAPGTRPPAPEAPTAPATASAKPEPVQPALPAPPKPEPAAPGVSAPQTVLPEPVKPEPATPVTREPAKPEPAKPEPAVPARPETPKPETPAATADMTPVTSTPETPAKADAGQVKKSLTLVNIGLHFKGSGMALRIEADAPFSYKTFALPSPDRYVVDLVGTWNKMRAPSVPSNNMIKGARAGKQAGGPRLVLDMQRSPKKHNVTWVTPTVLEIVIE